MWVKYSSTAFIVLPSMPIEESSNKIHYLDDKWAIENVYNSK